MIETQSQRNISPSKSPFLTIEKWILSTECIIRLAIWLLCVIGTIIIIGNSGFKSKIIHQLVIYSILGLLQCIFLHGIIRENICLTAGYAMYTVIAVGLAFMDIIVERDPGSTNAGVNKNSDSVLWWFNMICLGATIAVTLLYISDLYKLRQQKQNVQSETEGGLTAMTNTAK